MADPAAPGRTPPGPPRWVKLSAIVVAALVAVVIVVALVGGGEHGPGRHMRDGGTDENHRPPDEHSP